MNQLIANIFNLIDPSGACLNNYVNTRMGNMVLSVMAFLLFLTLLIGFTLYRKRKLLADKEIGKKGLFVVVPLILTLVICWIGAIWFYFVLAAYKPADAKQWETCRDFPNSNACKACQQNGAGSELCKKCEDSLQKFCSSTSNSDTFVQLVENNKSSCE